MVVIGDYDCMTTMNGNMKWMKLTHPLSIFSLYTFRAPFCTSTFTLEKINNLFINPHYRQTLAIPYVYHVR